MPIVSPLLPTPPLLSLSLTQLTYQYYPNIDTMLFHPPPCHPIVPSRSDSQIISAHFCLCGEFEVRQTRAFANHLLLLFKPRKHHPLGFSTSLARLNINDPRGYVKSYSRAHPRRLSLTFPSSSRGKEPFEASRSSPATSLVNNL